MDTLTELVSERKATAERLADLDSRIVLALAERGAPALEPDRLLTVPEAAERLDIKASYLYDLIRRQQVPSVRVGKFVKVQEATVRAIQAGKIQLG